MKESKILNILGIEGSFSDSIGKIESKIGAYSPKSKDPSKTSFRVQPGGRCDRELADLACRGLFNVGRQGEKKVYTPTKKYVDLYRSYVEFARKETALS